MKREVIVVGAGAAGLMCAIEAGRRGRSVLVLEHAERPGKKILISGGGRCNFTNLHATPENFLSGNPDFCKSALARYTPADFLRLVEQHGIAWHEKKLGQLFCDVSSKQIVEMLLKECEAARVEIRLNCKVNAVRQNDGFALDTSLGAFECDSLVIATGGLSIPKIGATDFGYRIAEQFGLRIIPPQPGLVPLTFGDAEQRAFGELSGISVDAKVSAGGASFREHLLFTHRGLSGPAILQISSYLDGGGAIALDLLPDQSARELLQAERGTNKELKTVLGQVLPQRFAQQWCAYCAPSKPMNRYTLLELEEIARRLQRWEIMPAGTEGYAKAEVTRGGVDTGELSSKTMESRRARGLYFIGEVVDVTGWLGGYNFQWAWASGHAAGQFV
ncbi:MAG TPA: NAD(P)/FAD-dependent oxidoreductase [Verrucomicrobiae bacterium]|nr:NAD(P)/FAD-dependent oxidoreductase [Verrucomicrobiae bacterium]